MILKKLALLLLLIFTLSPHSQPADTLAFDSISRTILLNRPSGGFGNMYCHDDFVIVTTKWYVAGGGEREHFYSAGISLIDYSDIRNGKEAAVYQSSEHRNNYYPDANPIYNSQAKGNHVYLTAENGLEIVNIQDPYNPFLEATYKPEGYEMYGGYIYIRDNTALLIPYLDMKASKIELLNIEDPTAPKRIGILDFGSNFISELIWDNDSYIYILGGVGDHDWDITSRVLSIVDVFSEEAPKIVNSIFAMNAKSIGKIDEHLYINNLITNYEPNKSEIYDLSDPASPMKIFETDLNYYFNNMIPFDEYYVSKTWRDKIVVYEMDGLIPREIYVWKGRNSHMVVRDQYIFTLSGPSSSSSYAIYVYELKAPSYVSFFDKF